MKRTLALKRLVGLDPTLSGIGSHQRRTHECTVCRTEFDTSDTCPACGSALFREKTRTPNALFNMVFVMLLAGFAIAYNILIGEYPKQGPGA